MQAGSNCYSNVVIFEILFNPITDKNIGITGATIIAGGTENKLLTIRGEHRECIKTIIVRNAFQPGAIEVYEVKIKWKPTLIFII